MVHRQENHRQLQVIVMNEILQNQQAYNFVCRHNSSTSIALLLSEKDEVGNVLALI